MENKISPEEAMFQRPSHLIEEIGYESGMAPEVSAYTDREMARLWSFEHMVRQGNELESRLLANNAQELWWVPQDTNVKKSLLWKENWGMLHAIRETSLRMYSGHNIQDPDAGTVTRVPGFVDEEHMKEAADQLLNQIHKEKEDSRNFELAELNHLWET